MERHSFVRPVQHGRCGREYGGAAKSRGGIRRFKCDGRWGRSFSGTPYGMSNRGDQSLREIATWMKGKHEVQFGGEILRVRLPMGNQYQESGVFDFENLTGSPSGGL